MEVPLAPTEEQRRIVAAIEERFARLDAGIAALKRAQANLKRYRASVLKAAVEGRLTEG
jgi:type I restriction enzyme S subunit